LAKFDKQGGECLWQTQLKKLLSDAGLSDCCHLVNVFGEVISRTSSRVRHPSAKNANNTIVVVVVDHGEFMAGTRSGGRALMRPLHWQANHHQPTTW